jgi:hypothetical protein
MGAPRAAALRSSSMEKKKEAKRMRPFSLEDPRVVGVRREEEQSTRHNV